LIQREIVTACEYFSLPVSFGTDSLLSYYVRNISSE
jgi:hypothetical protein